MIEISGIYTVRDTTHPYYWDIVFEWEDELSKALNLPLIPVGKAYDEIYRPSICRKILNRVNFYQRVDQYLFKPTSYFIAFHIGPPGVYSFYCRKNVIPIIIDFWMTENLRRFESIFSLSEIVFVTSRQVYNYLLKKKVRVKLDHLALSVPDSILSQKYDQRRIYDIIQLGRQNDKLTGYVKKLLKEFPEINYVFAEKISGSINMISTQQGNLGKFDSRDSFLSLLRKSKISLLSAPGLDGDAERTGGFSPVTPRFLESAACGCRLVGIYPENDDFAFYEINKICSNIVSYDNFRRTILTFLDSQEIPGYQDYLSNHLTSKRAFKLEEKFKSRYAK